MGRYGNLSVAEQWERDVQRKHHARQVASVKSRYSTQPNSKAKRRARRKDKQRRSLVHLTSGTASQGAQHTARGSRVASGRGSGARGASTSAMGRGGYRNSARGRAQAAQHAHLLSPDANDGVSPGSSSPQDRQPRRRSDLVAGGADFVVDDPDSEGNFLPGSSSVPILPDLAPGRLFGQAGNGKRQTRSTSHLPDIGGGGSGSGSGGGGGGGVGGRKRRAGGRSTTSQHGTSYKAAYKQSYETYANGATHARHARRRRKRQLRRPGAGIRPYQSPVKAKPSLYAQAQASAREPYAASPRVHRALSTSRSTASVHSHTSRRSAARAVMDARRPVAPPEDEMLYLNGQYTSRGARRGPADAAAIAQHKRRALALRNKLARRAERRREEKAAAEAAKLKAQLHSQFVKQVRKEKALERYYARREQGLPDTDYDEHGMSLATARRVRMETLVGASPGGAAGQNMPDEDSDLGELSDDMPSSRRKRKKRKKRKKHRRRKARDEMEEYDGGGVYVEYEAVDASSDAGDSQSSGSPSPHHKHKRHHKRKHKRHGTHKSRASDDGGKPDGAGKAPPRHPLRRHSTVAESDGETEGEMSSGRGGEGEGGHSYHANSGVQIVKQTTVKEVDDEYGDDDEYDDDGFEDDAAE